MTKKRIYAGASAVGQTHVKNGLPNQDAFAVIKSKKATVLAVSDGLGSKPLSHIGSQTAVRCIAEAVECVDETVEVADFIKLIQVLWKIRLKDTDASKYDCTCLFAVLFASGRLIGGLLGDGTVYADIGGEEIVLSGKSKEFANVIVSMNKCDLGDWICFDRKVCGEISLLLATDGIADDICVENLKSFYDSLFKNKVLLKGRQRKKNGCIKWILEHWTRPYSYDDKTLVIFKGKI